ncbi:SepM family pheromone-processing serine protease [Shouchella shacheensis]|uniref:SepM family pheromone-processing serine protease n=1 Tax=Shouchella shacheensis TaxID=1649580 RepID=UPI00074051DA|nr:SepM family pheromone-processing serine protease [Shouchella shacheensis]
MEQKRRTFPWKRWLILLVVLVVMSIVQLPYYYNQPGMAESLEGMIEVEGGYQDEEGTLMLTTIASAKATPFLAMWSLFSPYRTLYPVPAGLSDEEYEKRQVLLMSNSQEDAQIAAYHAAGAEVVIETNGVFVTRILEDMPAEGVIEAGDVIQEIEGEPVRAAEELLEALAGKTEADTVSVTFERGGEVRTEELGFAPFPEEQGAEPGRVGVGIAEPVTAREVAFDPEVEISAGAIGGPSAGFMFSLEIYNQLLEGDITKGYDIAGTGTINEDGDVGAIGGASQKVLAADQAEADFFFVPNQGGTANSNYKEAKQAAEDIDTDMVVVPIDTLSEALTYLESLQPKG